MASDSTNQPERNSVASRAEAPDHDPEGGEVEDRADRPEEGHEAADQPGVPVRRSPQLLLVDVVGRDRHLADVIEQVVEQDLGRQHRQEAEEQRGAAGAEHVPEVRGGPHQHVLDRVGEDSASLDDAAGEDLEVLVEQDDVGGVLGDVGRGLHRDADVGVVQGDGVVDAVAEEADREPEFVLGLDYPRLLLGSDPGEDRRLRQCCGELLFVELLQLAHQPTCRAPAGRGRRRPSAATRSLSPVITLTSTPRRFRRSSASAASAFGRSRKVRKPASSRSSSSVSVRDRPDPSPRHGWRRAMTRLPAANWRSSTCLRLRGHGPAAGEHALGRTLDDHLTPAIGVGDQDRRKPALVVERAPGEHAGSRLPAAARGARRRPQRLIELVAADHLSVGEGRLVAEQAGPQDRIRTSDRRRRAPPRR